MKIQNTFIQGKMNKDLDERLVPQGQYRDALNVRVSNSTGSDVGAVENSLSNELMSNLDLGANAVCLGAVSDDQAKTIYWFVKSDSGCFICFYNQRTEESGFVLSDTRLLTNPNPKRNVLNFQESYLIQANVIVDSDNLKTFLYFTDGLNPPRKINVDYAQSLDVSDFTEDDISVIVKPPLHSPKIRANTSETELEENNLKEKILSFSYRYVYSDNQKSALAPFSEIGFTPSRFSYDFIGAVNQSMLNIYDAIDIYYNTGSSLVKKIEIVFKEAGNNNIYLVSTIDKAKNLYSDNTEQSFTFKNNNIYKVLPEDEIFRLYDNVPLVAKAQDVIGNRLVYGNYEENFDLVDSDGEDASLELTASYTSEHVINDDPVKTARSSRDYEIGVVYLDDYGRSTTVQLSDNNHVYIPPQESIRQNTLKATISSKAPSFATHYRFFIKQTQENDHQILSPITIYDDADYTWIRLEGDDIQKLADEEYVIVKADLSGPKANEVKVKILERGMKSKNFLEDSTYTGPTQQESGYYIKINAYNVDISEASYTKYLIEDFDISSNRYETKFTGESTTYVEGPFYYSNQDAITHTMSVNSTYSGVVDRRYEIKILETGTTDKFIWRAWDINQGDRGGWSSPINCSTSNITLDTGIQISFGVITGHSVGDKFTFNYKTDITTTENGFDEWEERTYITLEGFPVSDEVITPGSKIALYYREYIGKNERSVVTEVDEVFYSAEEYANIEEWYWEEGYAQIIETDLVPDENIRFRRGIYTASTKQNNTFQITGNSSDKLAMIIESIADQRNERAGRAFATAKMTILKRGIDSFIVLETIPTKSNSDVYYEVPGTYKVDDCGYHLGLNNADQDQNFSNPAVLYLNTFFNAFSFGNGFESYKIRDAFIADSISIKNRPLTYIEDYRKNKRTSSITYSDVYEQSTNYNGLNEFNLARLNYTDVDDKYGSIERIHSRDSDLIVFQQNKVSKLLYNKSVIYNADGTGNVSQNLNVFGQQVPFIGEYGISNSPHSFTSWANTVYFADERRGAVLRLLENGLFEISQYGMRDWFRDNLNASLRKNILGGYDPFTGQYVLSIKDPIVEWREDAFECDQSSCDLEAIIYEKPATTTTTTAAPGQTTTSSTTTTTSATPLEVTFYGLDALGWTQSGLACAGTGIAITAYVHGSTGTTDLYKIHQQGYTLWQDSSLTVPYIGQNTYFKTVADANSGSSFRLTSGGIISVWEDCAPTQPPAPTGAYNLFYCDTGIGANLRVLDDGNLDTGMIITQSGENICYRVDNYIEITGGAFADYDEYDTCEECQELNAPTDRYGIILYYSSSIACPYSNYTTYYADTSDFCTATKLYTDANGTIPAPNGYYRTYTSHQSRRWTGISFMDSCQTCSTLV